MQVKAIVVSFMVEPPNGLWKATGRGCGCSCFRRPGDQPLARSMTGLSGTGGCSNRPVSAMISRVGNLRRKSDEVVGYLDARGWPRPDGRFCSSHADREY